MIDQSVPPISSTFAEIQRYSHVPLMQRLEYESARSNALALKGLIGFDAARERALHLLAAFPSR
jgi:hypothetical protein